MDTILSVIAETRKPIWWSREKALFGQQQTTLSCTVHAAAMDGSCLDPSTKMTGQCGWVLLVDAGGGRKLKKSKDL